MIVVAREHQQLALGAERRADRGEERRRQLGGVAVRRLAQLEPVAEHDQAVDAVQRLDQRRAQLGAAQEVVAARGTEVQIGDDERPHPTSVPGAAPGAPPAERRPAAAAQLASRRASEDARSISF